MRIHAHRFHPLGHLGFIHRVARHAYNLIRRLHPFRDLAECGILAIQVRRILHHDEKLRSGGIGHHAARHGEHAARMPERVLKAVARKLSADAVTRAACALSKRIAALNHKTGDHTVKNHPIIESAVGQLHKIGHAVWRHVRVKLAFHRAPVFHLNDKCGIHRPFPPPESIVFVPISASGVMPVIPA